MKQIEERRKKADNELQRKVIVGYSNVRGEVPPGGGAMNEANQVQQQHRPN